MTHSSQTHKVAYVAVVAALTAANAGCFDGMNQASDGDDSQQALNAKHSDTWAPPGLVGLGKSNGPWDAAEPMASATMEYVWEGMDLESGTVYEAPPGDPLAPEVDFHLAYNADTEVHIRVLQEYPALMAMLVGVPANEVGCEHLQGLAPEEAPIDEPLYTDDTLIIVTADGNTFKVGNAVEHDDMTVTFDYQQMNCGE